MQGQAALSSLEQIPYLLVVVVEGCQGVGQDLEGREGESCQGSGDGDHGDTAGQAHMTEAAPGKNTTLARYTARVPKCFTSRSMIVEKKMEVMHCRKRPKLPIRTPAGGEG